MILEVYTVLDKAVGAFLQPFYCRSKGEALRSFSDAANDEKNNFHRHSLDYELVYLGVFDDQSGLFSCANPSRIISARECVVPQDPFTEETKVSDAMFRKTNGRDKVV